MAKAAAKASFRAKRDAGTTLAEAVVKASTAEAAATPGARRKQAVVIVHGMGEQKPLETLRGFVASVWGGKPAPSNAPSDDDVWLVPDMRAGLTELARVTTRRNADGVATDFYELYWSDLLTGNTMSQLRGWLTGLLLRWPHQVPRETFSLWIALWVIVGAIAAIAAYVGLTGSWDALKKLILEADPLHNHATAMASIALALVLALALWRRLGRDLGRWLYADKTFPGIWATVTPRAASVSVVLSWATVLAVPVAIGFAAYRYFPWSVLESPKSWALLAAAVISYVLVNWVVPVFGDVARYVRTAPDAVAARAKIRDRGVELLRALHGPMKATDALKYDFGSEDPYERIVVVGHSLGSIIAYDILRLFWEERGPTRQNPASDTTLVALRDLDGFCGACSAEPVTLDVTAFREGQGRVAAALAQEENGWRVSDFVTLGSPLTHAEFLVSRDRAAFEERKAERLFPTCPPMLEPGGNSFLYSDAKYAHHAAMFSAMRWTNIHDSPEFLFLGDFISGPCASNFGPGVVDVRVAIRKPGLLRRLVTHTHYWDSEAGGSASDAEGAKLGLGGISQDPKAHLTLLKKALALR